MTVRLNYYSGGTCSHCGVKDGMKVHRSWTRKDGTWTDELDLVSAHPEEWHKVGAVAIINPIHGLCQVCRNRTR